MSDKRLVMLMRSELLLFGGAIAAGILAGIVIIWQAKTVATIIDNAFLHHQPFSRASLLLALLLMLALARAAMSWASEMLARTGSARIKTLLRSRLMQHVFQQGPVFTKREQGGELTTTIVSGVEELEEYFSQFVPQGAYAVAIPLLILLIVFPIDMVSGSIFVLTVPMIPLLMALIGMASDVVSRQQWSLLSRMSAHFLDVLQGLTTLKEFGRSKRQTAIVARISELYRKSTMKVLSVTFLNSFALELVSTISTAIIAVEIGFRLLYAQIGFGEAFFVLLLAPEFYLPLRTLGARYHAAMSGMAASTRIFHILEQPVAKNEHTDITYTPDIHQPMTLHNVSFAYDNGDRPALRSVSLTIEPGKITAIVGSTGAGKSTIVDLLLRFMEPDSGYITVGDIPLQSIDVDWWRRNIAWVPSNPHLFYGTIRENLALSRPDAADAEMFAALRKARADVFVQALPDGLATLVGERGARLSGGQIQRIALARAFLRNAPILILDEAISHLDPRQEAEVQQSIDELARDRTVLVIAHRLTTVAKADHNIVLDQGTVVGAGTHQELEQAHGIYRRMFAAYEVSQ